MLVCGSAVEEKETRQQSRWTIFIRYALQSMRDVTNRKPVITRDITFEETAGKCSLPEEVAPHTYQASIDEEILVKPEHHINDNDDSSGSKFQVQIVK